MLPLRLLHETGKGQYGTAIRIALGIWGVAAIALAVSVAARGISDLAVAIALVGLLTMGLMLVAIAARAMGRLADILASISLQAALARKGWQPEAFFTDGAAATPPLSLLLLKCLEFCKPRKVLELGSGQSSKLLALYHRDTPGVEVTTFEHDKEFAELMRTAVTHQGRVHNYCWAPLVPTEFSVANGVRISTEWYDRNVTTLAGPFDLVLVDGPDDINATYGRAGVLTVIPEALASTFVVIFDDADRYGIAKTTELFGDLLRKSGRSFIYFEVHGIKTHAVFCSNTYRFLRST
jgi:predicted O-methyltransferase YrrM